MVCKVRNTDLGAMLLPGEGGYVVKDDPAILQ